MPRALLRKTRDMAWGLNLRQFPGFDQGAYVVSVSENSPARAFNIRAGDVITSVNGKSLKNSTIPQIQMIFTQADVVDLEFLSQPNPAARTAQQQQASGVKAAASSTITSSGSKTKTMTITPPARFFSSSTVIDLVDDSDDDDDDEDINIGRLVEPRGSASRLTIATSTPAGRSVRSGGSDIIDLVSDSEPELEVEKEVVEPPRRMPRLDDNINSSSSSLATPPLLTSSIGSAPSQTVTFPCKRMHGKIEIKLEFPPKDFGEANVGDEVVEIRDPNQVDENDRKRSHDTAFGDDDDDEFIIVGSKMTVASDMPHQRESCTKHRFQHHAPKGNQANMLYCPNCYCYICEVKASECNEWAEHSSANCKDQKWKQLRSTHYTPLMKLLSPAQKSSFLKKYEHILQSATNSGYDSEDSDLRDAHMYGYGYGYGYNHNKAGEAVETCISVATNILNKDSITNDEFLEASALIIRLLALKFQFKLSDVKTLVVQWLIHPFCTMSLIEAFKKVLEQHHPFDQVPNFKSVLMFLPGFIQDPNSRRDKISSALMSELSNTSLKYILLRIIDKVDQPTLTAFVQARINDDSWKYMLIYVLSNAVVVPVATIEKLFSINETNLLNYAQQPTTFDGKTCLKVIAMAIDSNQKHQISGNITSYFFLPMLKKLLQCQYETLESILTNFMANPLINKVKGGSSLSIYEAFVSCDICINEGGVEWSVCVEYALVMLCLFCDSLLTSFLGFGSNLLSCMKKVSTSPMEYHASWLYANALARWYYPQLQNCSGEKVCHIMEGINILLTPFFDVPQGKTSIRLFNGLHPWITHDLARMFTIHSTLGGQYDLVYFLSSNLPQQQHSRIDSDASKAHILKLLFEPRGALADVKSLIVGSFWTMKQVVNGLKFISNLLLDAQGIAPDYHSIYKQYHLIFRMVWKGIYMNFYGMAEDSVNSYGSLFEFNGFLGNAAGFNWYAACENQQQPEMGVESSEYECRIFFRCMSLFQQKCNFSNMGKDLTIAVSELKKDILAFDKLIHDSNSELVFNALKLFFVTTTTTTTTTGNDVPTEPLSSSNTIWEEWKSWIPSLLLARSFSPTEEYMVMLVLEDFKQAHKKMINDTDVSIRLSKYPFKTFHWIGDEVAVVKRLKKLASILESCWGSHARSEFDNSRNVSMRALMNPSSLLGKCVRYLSTEFLSQHSNSMNPIVYKVICEKAFSLHAISAQKSLFSRCVDSLQSKLTKNFKSFIRCDQYDVILCCGFMGQLHVLPDWVFSYAEFMLIIEGHRKLRGEVLPDIPKESEATAAVFFKQLIMNIEPTFLDKCFQKFEMILKKLLVSQVFYERMKEVMEYANGCIVKSSTAPKDCLHIKLFNFLCNYSEDAFNIFWLSLRSSDAASSSSSSSSIDNKNVEFQQSFVDLVTTFSDEIVHSNLSIAQLPSSLKTYWVVLATIKGANFVRYLQSSVSFIALSNTSKVQLVVVLIEKVYKFRETMMINVDEQTFLILLAGLLLTIPSIGNDIKLLLRSHINESVLVVDNPLPSVDLECPIMSKSFSQLLISCLCSPNSISAIVKAMAKFKVFTTVKESIFECVSDPNDPGITFNLMLNNRMFSAIGEYIKKQLEIKQSDKPGSNGVVVNVKLVAQSIQVLKSQLVMDHFREEGASIDVQLETQLTPKCLLRVLYKICVYLQLRFFSTSDVNQQPVHAAELRSAVDDLSTRILGILLPPKMVVEFVKCFADLFEGHRLVEVCCYFAKCSLMNEDERRSFLTDILNVGVDANYIASTKLALEMSRLVAKNALPFIIEAFSTKERQNVFISSFFVKPCTYWTQSDKVKVEVTYGYGVVEHFAQVPCDLRFTKLIEDSLSDRTVATKTLELPLMMVVNGFHPDQLIKRAEQSVLNIFPTIDRTPFFALLQKVFDAQSIKNPLLANVWYGVNKSTIAKDVISFRDDPMYPVWIFTVISSLFQSNTIQTMVELLIVNHSRTPKLFPEQIRLLLVEHICLHYYIDICEDLKFEGNFAVELVVKCPEVVDYLMLHHCPASCSFYILAARTKVINRLCEARPDNYMAQKVAVFLKYVGTIIRTTTMNVANRGLIETQIIPHLKKIKLLFVAHGLGAVFDTAKNELIRNIKSKKAVSTLFEAIQ